ncbi:MAG: SURF1 family protein [Tagaea sp.]
MLNKIVPGFAPRLIPTLIALPGMVLLLSLSGWQLSRHFERATENALREARLAMPAADIDVVLADPAADRFRRVRASGVWAHERELYVYGRSQRGNDGFYIITPLLREGAPALLVNRGWVDRQRREPATRPQGQVSGPVVVEGVLRDEPRRGPLMPDNEPDRNQWFWYDLPAMAKAAGLPAILPVYVEAALEPRNPGGWPLGGQTIAQLPRPHLQYAFTWFCLAIALAAVYLISQRRKP